MRSGVDAQLSRACRHVQQHRLGEEVWQSVVLQGSSALGSANHL
jgi:hypothetical protein